MANAARANLRPTKCKHPPTKPPEGAKGLGIASQRAGRASVDRLEDLARLGMVTCKLVKPHISFRQLVGLMSKREMG
jgi:hypothetical protein